MNADILMIKGAMTELSEEGQTACKELADTIRYRVTEAEKKEVGSGILALALVGLEIQNS
jgi:hypothetical protein